MSSLPLTDSYSHSLDNQVGRAYLANWRHELRTPMNAIIGYSEILLEDFRDCPDPAAVQPWQSDVEIIHEQGQKLLELVNRILDPESIDAEATQAEIADQVHMALRTPLNTIIGYAELLLEDIEADYQDDLGRILTACQRLLGMIDGLIQLSASPTTMPETATEEDSPTTFFLPSEEDITVSVIQEVIDKLKNMPTHGQWAALGSAILVVDDNEMNRDLLQRRLERQGYRVYTAANGRRALEVMAQQSIDLVLLDIMMPEMNGYQVLEHLKAEPHWREIPVIVITAFNELDCAVHCIEMGAEDLLSKPFNQVLLRARVNACLEKKQLRDQEIEYLEQVQRVTSAAAAVESGTFELEHLSDVAKRPDQLGQLARVFQQMAKEVRLREQRLQKQVQALRIEIDHHKRDRQVSEITETDYFQNLQQRAKDLRRRLS